MKTLFEVLEAHEQSIRLSVPLSDLRRIYGWSNMYVHTGMRDYIWLPYFATKYLNSFFRGGEHASRSSVYTGIITSKATIEAIQADVEAKIDATTQDLWKIPAEQCEVALDRLSLARHSG